MRLVDADKLLKCIPPEELCNRIAVANAPTIEERKTGQWIDDNCSECGQYVYHGDARNYCPKCGAKMEGEEHESD